LLIRVLLDEAQDLAVVVARPSRKLLAYLLDVGLVAVFFGYVLEGSGELLFGVFE